MFELLTNIILQRNVILLSTPTFCWLLLYREERPVVSLIRPCTPVDYIINTNTIYRLLNNDHRLYNYLHHITRSNSNWATSPYSVQCALPIYEYLNSILERFTVSKSFNKYN